MTYKRLISFDFDDTMCHTPKPEEGKIIWKEKTGTEWPYGGWWGKAESINPEVFDIPVNPWVYKKYLEAVSDPDNYVILATGRLKKVPNMLNHVETILNKHNLSFDEIHLNWGGDTYNFKTKLFETLIKEVEATEMVMYDDRQSHLIEFEEWSKKIDCKISIIDVVNKTIKKFNH